MIIEINVIEINVINISYTLKLLLHMLASMAEYNNLYAI